MKSSQWQRQTTSNVGKFKWNLLVHFDDIAQYQLKYKIRALSKMVWRPKQSSVKILHFRVKPNLKMRKCHNSTVHHRLIETNNQKSLSPVEERAIILYIACTPPHVHIKAASYVYISWLSKANWNAQLLAAAKCVMSWASLIEYSIWLTAQRHLSSGHPSV